MRIFFSKGSGAGGTYLYPEVVRGTYILESFYYADEMTQTVIIPNARAFMLDSGAFTFLQNAKTKLDWDDYLRRYAEFIVENNVQEFFELDIDPIVGYKQVLKMRARLEELTGRRCIPVWHTSRGYAEFLKMCDEYDYVAVGGIVSKEIKPKQYPIFTRLIKDAHAAGTKIHGLGFTSLEGVKQYHFDSVDSTAWTAGNRFGYVYYFDGTTMRKRTVKEGERLADARRVAVVNFTEWVKFQYYADKNL